MKLKSTSLKVLDEIRKDPQATYRELQERCGLSSISVVYYHINVLEKAGEITKKPGTRGIFIGERPKGNYSGRYTMHKSAEEISRIRSAAARKSRRSKWQAGAETRKRNASKSGEAALPRMSAAELKARIEIVAEKAISNEQSAVSYKPGWDVVRIEPGKMLKSIKCHRVG